MSEHQPRLPRHYKVFSIVFFLLCALGLAGVSFVTWSRAEIILIPSRQAVDFEFSVAVGPEADVSKAVVSGSIVHSSADSVREFTATGKRVVTYTAGTKTPLGSVMLHNTGSVSQTLIATTRLAQVPAPDVVVARLTQTVTVPAGGTISATVFTDQPQQFKEIGPGKLIIPGLRQNIWDVVYAEVATPLNVRDSVVIVSQDDINQATKAVADTAAGVFSKKIDEQLSAERRTWPKLIATTMSKTTFDATVDAEAAKFIGSATVEGVGVVFDPSQLIAVAHQKLRDIAGIDTSHMVLRIEDFSYRLDSSDSEAKTAQVTVHITTNAATLTDPALFVTMELAGKTQDEVRAYYKKYSDIADVQIITSPNWRSTLPGNPARITVRVNSQ